MNSDNTAREDIIDNAIVPLYDWKHIFRLLKAVRFGNVIDFSNGHLHPKCVEQMRKHDVTTIINQMVPYCRRVNSNFKYEENSEYELMRSVVLLNLVQDYNSLVDLFQTKGVAIAIKSFSRYKVTITSDSSSLISPDKFRMKVLSLFLTDKLYVYTDVQEEMMVILDLTMMAPTIDYIYNDVVNTIVKLLPSKDEITEMDAFRILNFVKCLDRCNSVFVKFDLPTNPKYPKLIFENLTTKILHLSRLFDGDCVLIGRDGESLASLSWTTGPIVKFYLNSWSRYDSKVVEFINKRHQASPTIDEQLAEENSMTNIITKLSEIIDKHRHYVIDVKLQVSSGKIYNRTVYNDPEGISYQITTKDLQRYDLMVDSPTGGYITPKWDSDHTWLSSGNVTTWRFKDYLKPLPPHTKDTILSTLLAPNFMDLKILDMDKNTINLNHGKDILCCLSTTGPATLDLVKDFPILIKVKTKHSLKAIYDAKQNNSSN